MNVTYDRPGDILYVRFVAPSGAQVLHETSEGVYLVINRETDALEGYVIHGISARPGGDFVEFDLPAARKAHSAA